MANITRLITITEEGTKSGPYFDVYYSLDCINYTICSDGSNVYLPTVGSSVSVTLPDNSTCLKLQSLSQDCPGVFVVENLVTTTTTTTTSTTTTSTTSTTTTAAPTTTTTTIAPKFWNAVYCNNGNAVGVPLKMAGIATTGSVVQAGSGIDTCASLSTVYIGTPVVFFDKTAATIYGNCSACGITTTTTSTTTTPAPVWYNLYNCSNGQIQTSTQYPDGTFSVNQRVVYGGALYFYVVSKVYSNPGGFQWLVSSAGSGLTGCPITTTTTTTTTIPPIKLALTASCSGTNNVLLANGFSGGNGTYLTIASGSTESNAFTAQQISLGGASSYTFNGLPNGTWYVVLRDSSGNAGFTSASLSCNTTTTTSTTTTIAPPTFSFLTNTGRNGSTAACSATKNIYVWAYSNMWDNGVTYYEGTISGPNLPLSTYPGASQWFANGGVALQIDDNGLSSNATACPTTTTTTTTIPPTKYTYLLYDINPTTCATTGTPTPIWSYLSFSNGYYKIESDPTTYYLEVSTHTDYTLQFLSATSATCTPVTTTTTTLQPVWYNLYNCYDGTSTTSRQYPIGTFSVGQRVAYGTGGSILYFNVVSQVTSNPGGIQWDVYSVAGTGCPATTTTTTTTTLAPVQITYHTECINGQGYITIDSMTGGSGTGYQFSIQPTPGFWYDYPTYTQLGPLESGRYYNVAYRASAGQGGNTAIYIDCPTTTTTTTQAPTTTTTTSAPGTAYVSITNQMFGGTITDVTVNGVSIVGASFPLAVGDGTSGTTDQMGINQTVRVYFSGATPSPQYIQVTDAIFATQCSLAAGTSNRLFTNVTVTNNSVLDIYAGDGYCP